MAGENGLIIIPSYGHRRIVVTKIITGMKVVTFMNVEDESRTRKAFLTYKRTSGSFDLTLVHTSHRAYERFNEWLSGFARWNASPHTKTVAPRVVVPSRRFDKTGTLEGTMSFGDEVGSSSYYTSLSFMGSGDPQDISRADLRSQFEPPESTDPALIYLYPAGTQLSGRQGGYDTITEFDDAPDVDLDEIIAGLGGGGAPLRAF